MTLRLILSSACLLIALQSSAQDYHKYKKISNPFYMIELPVLEDQKQQYIIDNKIDSIETKRYGFKKNGTKKKFFWGSTYHLNSQGQIIRIDGRDNKKEFGHSEYTYHDNGKVATHVYYNRKGEIENTYAQHFDGVKSAYVKLNSKGDTVVHVVRGLVNEQHTSADYYYKKGKLKNRWLNEYDTEDKLEQVTFYKGNGKVKYIWDYRCKDDGVEINKHKDTTTVCTSITKGEDGTTTYVYQHINEKGELVKYINRLNKADKLLHYRRLKGVEEVIEYEYDIEYDDDDSTITNTLSKYYKKGNLKSVTDRTYDADHYFVSHVVTRFKKGEIISESTRVYEYGENGLPSRFVRENKLRKYKGVTEYQFHLKPTPILD
ncbi:MAG: hypothetical protein ACI9JN_001886 [Bacteroidia bacterium]|jgi:hypothetical protein